MSKEREEIEDRLTGGERLMLEQNRRANFRAEMENAAHERHMRRRQNFIESNPGAVSPWERQAIVGRAQAVDDRNRLMTHEMDMLEQRGRNDFAVAGERTRGLVGQGAEAAKVRAEADKEAARINAESLERRAGIEAEWRKHAADQEAAWRSEQTRLGLEGEKYKADAASDAAEAQHGYIDKTGTYHPGEGVAIAERRAAADVEAARAAREAEAARFAMVRQDRIDAATERRIDTEVANLRKDPKNKEKSEEDLRAMATATITGQQSRADMSRWSAQ